MRTADFDYPLPPELIAQHPAPERDQSRLLMVDRGDGRVHHERFPDLLSHLRPNDLLVMNNSKVIPARLRGFKPDTGGQVEMLLVEECGVNDWWVMLRPGKRVRPGSEIVLRDLSGNASPIRAVLQEKNEEGHCRVLFQNTANILDALETLGEMPLPPYIERAAGATSAEDLSRYQTVYAKTSGSVAAPTAGLHFTQELLKRIESMQVKIAHVTLHVGLGTFAPVKVDDVESHIMHAERFEMPQATVDAIAATRAAGGRVIAVGTTSVRVLESVAAQNDGALKAMRGQTRIFIYPPYRFRVVDALVTNFHLPQSTLLMLVSAFAAPGDASRGREIILNAYAAAVKERYRFFSYGDAMFIQ